jgi:hypothetical protein
LIAKRTVVGEALGFRQLGDSIIDRRRGRTALAVELEVAEYELVLGAARER